MLYNFALKLKEEYFINIFEKEVTKNLVEERIIKGVESDKIEIVGKTLFIKRVNKVIKGGRTINFSVLAAVGDQNGGIGIGKGKAHEVSLAVYKALEQAKHQMINVPLNNGSIYHEVIGKHGASMVWIAPASEGTGIIAGGPMRSIFEVIGIRNIVAKSIGSNNSFNVARATLNGMLSIHSPEYMADKLGKYVIDILI